MQFLDRTVNLRSFEIGMHFHDVQSAQRNFDTAQVDKLRGTDTLLYNLGCVKLLSLIRKL